MEQPLISIVSGTYNRLSRLKRMVESARASVSSLSYEIVLVDGGSNDGSLEWAHRQPDVCLIEHGALLGAVRAFNDGAYAARGTYVALLNDDIELIGDSLARAAAYLDTRLEVGQVAFENQVQNGRARRPPLDYAFGFLYGQCCLTRRWLGDLVGWWGEGYHTYAGDTELGVKIWEAGFRVEAVEGCAILDHVLEDNLRAINNQPGGRHSDSVLFYKRWDHRLPANRQAWVGNSPAASSHWRALAGRHELRSLRLKIVPQGYRPRLGLLQALREMGPAEQINQTETQGRLGPDAFQKFILDTVSHFRPHLLLLQEQGAPVVWPETITRLREWLPDLAIVNFNGDARRPVDVGCLKIARVCHLSLIVSPSLFAEYEAAGAANVAYWPISYEPEYGVVRRATQTGDFQYDLVFTGTNYTTDFPDARARLEAALLLKEQKNLKVGLFGHGWGRLADGATDDDHATTAAIYGRARLGLSISHFNDLWGYSSDRLYWLTAAGVPTLLYQFAGMEEHGFVDGETCIAWATLPELLQKVDYYLAHVEERERIGAAGWALTTTRHSWPARTQTLLSLLESV